MDWLLEPFTHAFMIRSLIAAIMVGTVSALVGTYVVLRGMAFFGDALAHAILPGVAVGYFIGAGQGVFWWALLTSILASLGIGAISKSAQLKEDTAIGIIFAGMFALGIAMISRLRSVDPTHLLFGHVLGVSNQDLWLIGIVGGLVILTVIAFYKEFMVLSFDPVLAATLRIPGQFFEYFLLILIAVTVVVSLQTVGVTLIIAMLVTPAASAFLLTKRLPIMMLLAAAMASLSGVIGLYISFYFNVASGAAIVLASTVIFVFVWGVQRVRLRFI